MNRFNAFSGITKVKKSTKKQSRISCAAGSASAAAQGWEVRIKHEGLGELSSGYRCTQS